MISATHHSSNDTPASKSGRGLRRSLEEAHLFTRLFEWMMVLALTMLGAWLMVWPSALGASAFRYVLFGHMTWLLPWLFLLWGLFSSAALGANGHLGRLGCMIRAWAALSRAVLWGEMALALVNLHLTVGSPPSPGIPIYAMLMIGEMVSCYTAASDGSYYKRTCR